MNIWKPLDVIADWVQHGLSVQAQERMAVLCIILSLPLAAYGPFSGEQLIIYEMSALALTLTGITWLTGLSARREVKENGS